MSSNRAMIVLFHTLVCDPKNLFQRNRFARAPIIYQMPDLKDGLRLWVVAWNDLGVTLLCRKIHQFRSQAEGMMFKTHLDFQIICIRTSV